MSSFSYLFPFSFPLPLLHRSSPAAQSVKNLPGMQEIACNVRGPGSVSESGRSPGEGKDNLLQYFCLGNPIDRGVWRATVHVVTRFGHNLVTKPPPPCWCRVIPTCPGQASLYFTKLMVELFRVGVWPSLGVHEDISIVALQFCSVLIYLGVLAHLGKNVMLVNVNWIWTWNLSDVPHVLLLLLLLLSRFSRVRLCVTS